MAQRISTREYETQSKEYTKKALSELRHQMNAQKIKEESDEDEENDEEIRSSDYFGSIISLTAKNADLKCRLDKQERINHYLKLDLNNCSCDLADTKEKLQIANKQIDDTTKARQKLAVNFLLCVIISVIGFFSGGARVYLNEAAYAYLLFCVEKSIKTTSTQVPIFTFGVLFANLIFLFKDII